MSGSGESDHGGASLTDAWEEEAEGWIRWARTPGHDDYYELYNLPAFLELLPAPGRCTIDLGCGEGRVARVLRGLGHAVVGVEPSSTLVGAARAEDPTIPVVRGRGDAVPLASGRADLVVCFMVLQDVDDLPAVCTEIARLLAADGVACLAIVHPIASSGFPDPHGAFQYVGRYLEVMRNVLPVERNGIEFTFHSAHRPIEVYSRAFEAAGLVVRAIREPGITEALVVEEPRLARHRLLPNFLHFTVARG
ncbi:MAG: class I SAM-dependent methyltransferase [Acidimicrobiia bacterium]